jgi:hypothetical protein
MTVNLVSKHEAKTLPDCCKVISNASIPSTMFSWLTGGSGKDNDDKKPTPSNEAAIASLGSTAGTEQVSHAYGSGVQFLINRLTQRAGRSS